MKKQTELEKVQETLLFAKNTDMRIRIWYGEIGNGGDWLEQHDIMGYVGRSTGSKPAYLLLARKTSQAGGAILEKHVMMIADMKTHIQYRHPDFTIPEMHITSYEEFADGYADELAEGYTHKVSTEDDMIGHYKSYEKAKNMMDFMQGVRMRK